MLTSALSSLRMALAATPVVDVLKSMWDAPRTRALKDSLLGMRESEAIGLDAMGDEDGKTRKKGETDTHGLLMWMGFVVFVEMRRGR